MTSLSLADLRTRFIQQPFAHLADVLPDQFKNDSRSKYGRTELFPALKEKAVLELASMLVSMKNDRSHIHMGDRTNYRAILKRAATLRRDIATQTASNDIEKFGVMRGTKDSDIGQLYTHLYAASYKQINKRIKDLAVECIQRITNKKKGMRITKGCSRYTFRLRREIDEIDKLLADPRKLALGTNKLSTPEENADIQEALFASAAMTTQFQEYVLPCLYVAKGNNSEPSPFSHPIYVYTGRIEMKIGNEWRVLTRHMAVIESDWEGNITAQHIADFSAHLFTSLLHAPAEDFVHHEASMAHLFNSILSDSTPRDQLPCLIREFEYRLHHLCYFQRGSAAINEMILEAIQKVCCPEYVIKGNLEALAQPFFSDF